MGALAAAAETIAEEWTRIDEEILAHRPYLGPQPSAWPFCLAFGRREFEGLRWGWCWAGGESFTMGDIPLGCWINRYLQLIEAGIQGVDPLPLPYAAAPTLPHRFLFPPPFCVATLRRQSWRGSEGCR